MVAKAQRDVQFSAASFQAGAGAQARLDRSGVRADHGRDRRSTGSRVRRVPPRTGRVRSGKPPAGDSGAAAVSLRRGDCGRARRSSRQGGEAGRRPPSGPKPGSVGEIEALLQE